MSALRAFAELSEDSRRIEVHFKYSEAAVEAIRAVPGRHWDQKNRYWTIPADMTSAKRLREEFGRGLELGDAVQAWGREQNRIERNLREIKTADDATLKNVAADDAAWLRPYQRADIAQMAAKSVLNANQPGVGKTVEAIYAVQESGLKGPHLVVCPTSLFKDPWRDELAKHAPGATVLWGDTPAARRDAIAELAALVASGEADNVWLLLNPEMVRLRQLDDIEQASWAGMICSKDHKGRAYVPKDDATEQLMTIKWGAVIADEFHKFGLGADRNTQFARGLKTLRANAARGWAMSGTPMGGKPVRLWGVLNFVEPERFSSKWRWAEQWLEIDDNGYGKKIGGLLPGREGAFEEAHSSFIIRRTRASALPGLPPKVTINVKTPMTSKQRKAYAAFVKSAEVALEGGRVASTGVLAEYARAKQFANALCKVVDGEVQPTTESGKLPLLLDRLDTFGIRREDAEPGARAIVASESQRFVALLETYLGHAGLNVRRLDGTVPTGAKREAVLDWYKAESADARILVMTTQTGGVGLNLGMTGSVHILDETWNPDDQEQLEDRGMRNRTTPLTVLYYRTEDSIQQYIEEIGKGKKLTNQQMIDLRTKLRGEEN